MKKSISILLVLIMVSSCFALASCNWSEIFGKTTTKTTTMLPDASTVEFEHSDNFTVDDIEFVRMLHGKKRGGYMLHNSVMSFTLWDIIELGQGGSPIFLAHFENPYIIVPYIKPNIPNYEYDENGNYYFDVRRYVWCKFNVSEDIPDSIGGCERGGPSYLLYDCTIRKDIANGIEYNRECKYYLEYEGESSFNRTTTDMLIYYPGYINIGELRFIQECRNNLTRYELYVDDDKTEYLIFPQKVIYEDDTISEGGGKFVFGDYYDILFPYFHFIDELDYHTVSNGRNIIRKYAGVNIEVFENILFRRNNDEY